jgi:hypothetical protein
VHLCEAGSVSKTHDQLVACQEQEGENKASRTGSGSVQVTNDVGHTGLVTHDGGKVDRLGRVILLSGNETTSC